MNTKSTIKPVYGPTNPRCDKSGIQRFGSVIGLNLQMERRYRELHANVWESVTERLRSANIRNYSIYLAELEGKKYLFSYFEYIGNDLESDMQSIANDPETRRWWKETDPCQIQLPDRSPGANWSDMEGLFLLV